MTIGDGVLELGMEHRLETTIIGASKTVWDGRACTEVALPKATAKKVPRSRAVLFLRRRGHEAL